MKNFGFAGETEIVAPGINGKMDEIRSAYGLLNLKQVDNLEEYLDFPVPKFLMLDDGDYLALVEARRKILRNIKGLHFMEDIPGVRHNYSYFPIFVDAEKYGMTRDELYFKMKEQNVFGRRYFYPLISEFSTYRGLDSARLDNLPVAHKIANSVICLPMYAGLSEDDINRILIVLSGECDYHSTTGNIR